MSEASAAGGDAALTAPAGGRELWLLRHAKSDRSVAGLGDHERDLAPRGRRASAALAAMLAQLTTLPDHVLCSTATRTRATLSLLEGGLGVNLAARFERRLYLAPPETMLALARGTDDGVRCLMMVGHNPGMEGLMAMLLGPGDAAARGGTAFPTCALARLAVPGRSWSGLQPGGARLLGFWRPRDDEAG